MCLTDSTFADQFYGMRYRSSLPDRPSARPSSRQKALILAFIVSLFPLLPDLHLVASSCDLSDLNKYF
jgi:hypothetical protein